MEIKSLSQARFSFCDPNPLVPPDKLLADRIHLCWRCTRQLELVYNIKGENDARDNIEKYLGWTA
jgi:hypothetical protein